MKFGGSCLRDKDAFNRILDITKIYSNDKKVYVASAFNGITDLLLSLANNLKDPIETDNKIAFLEKRHLDIIESIFETESNYFKHARNWIYERLSELEDAIVDIKEFGLEPYYQDYILSFGERISTFILKEYLLSKDLDSEFISANNVIITNDEFNNAYPFYELTNARVQSRLMPLLENPTKDTIICVTGFIARNKIGYITTLGRGGSDYTASILARSIYDVGSDKNIRVLLWKDVNGLLAINPKYITNPTLIRFLNYKEAKEIANFGVKVIHPKCLEAIERRKIPLEIRNFNNPKESVHFSLISDYTDREQIKGISAIEEAAMITVTSGTMVDVPGVLAKIFRVMGKSKISVSFVSQSSAEVSTSFIVDKENSINAIDNLRHKLDVKEFFEITSKEVSVINITGSIVLENNTKAKIFNALDKRNIQVKAISQSYEELNLSIVIEKDKLTEAIQLIHNDLCQNGENNYCVE